MAVLVHQILGAFFVPQFALAGDRRVFFFLVFLVPGKRCVDAIDFPLACCFLGLGVTPPTPTWGIMLSMGFENIRSEPSLIFAPALAIFLLVLSINFIGDGLRDVLDPRLRNEI